MMLSQTKILDLFDVDVGRIIKNKVANSKSAVYYKICNKKQWFKKNFYRDIKIGI